MKKNNNCENTASQHTKIIRRSPSRFRQIKHCTVASLTALYQTVHSSISNSTVYTRILEQLHSDADTDA